MLATPSQAVSQRAQLCERVGGRTAGRWGRRAQPLESTSQLSGGRAKFSLEVQVLEGEVRLHDACGLDSGPQDVLLRGDVGGLGYPVQVVQVAGRKRRRGENKGGSEEERREGSLGVKMNLRSLCLCDEPGGTPVFKLKPVFSCFLRSLETNIR